MLFKFRIYSLNILVLTLISEVLWILFHSQNQVILQHLNLEYILVNGTIYSKQASKHATNCAEFTIHVTRLRVHINLVRFITG